MMTSRKEFNDFWPTFVQAHLDPWNRRFHIFGNLWMAGNWAAFLLTGQLGWLVLAMAGYLPSWVGHIVFEGNLPVTLGSPILSALCDLKMMGFTLTGNMRGELERLFGTSCPKAGAPLRVTRQQERAYQESMRLFVGSDIPWHPFSDYWEIFLLKHRNAWNVWLHVAAMLFLYTLPIYVLATHQWHLLLAIPLAQITGLLAHFCFERSYIDFEDAIFSWRAFTCLNRMTLLALTGRYWDELEKVRKELEANQRQAPRHGLVSPSVLNRSRIGPDR